MSKVALVLAATVASLPIVTHATVFGTLGNFDAVNDTGQTAHGFEIDLQGIHSSDVTDVFGGPGRGFPTTVERYGSPTITDYSSGGTFGVKITYAATFSGGAWSTGTPSGVYSTLGESCWTGGGGSYDATTPCDHFGVGTIANPTTTIYHWLIESGTPGVLTNGTVNLPAPIWTVIPAPPPPPGQPEAPPMVVALVEAPPIPPGDEFGDAIWVKVFTTELDHEVELEDLMAENPDVPNGPGETEIEWQLLQKEAGNPLSGMLENGEGAAVGAGAESVLRRYEYYAFTGQYDPDTHEARFLPGFGDTNPGPDDVGNFLGAQNAAANLNAIAPVPEPGTLAAISVGLAGLGFMRRRRAA